MNESGTTLYCFQIQPPIPQNNVKYKDITIVSGKGVNLAPKFVLSGNSKEKVGKETPPDALLVYNLDISLATTMDKACGNTGRKFCRGSSNL